MLSGKISFTAYDLEIKDRSLFNGASLKVDELIATIADSGYNGQNNATTIDDINRKYFCGMQDEIEEDFLIAPNVMSGYNYIAACVLTASNMPNSKILKRELETLYANTLRAKQESNPGKKVRVEKDERIELKMRAILKLAMDTPVAFKMIPFILMDTGRIFIGANGNKSMETLNFIVRQLFDNQCTTSRPVIDFYDGALDKLTPFSFATGQEDTPSNHKHFMHEFCTWMSIGAHVGKAVSAVCTDRSTIIMKSFEEYEEIPQQIKDSINKGAFIQSVDCVMESDMFGYSANNTLVTFDADGNFKGIDPKVGAKQRFEEFDCISSGCNSIVNFFEMKMKEFCSLRLNPQKWASEISSIGGRQNDNY